MNAERKLKILLLEDSDDDARLEERALRRGGCNFSLRLVQTRDEFVRALREDTPDVVVSDYQLPGFDGRTSLALSRELAPQAPVIIVTGVMQDDLAVQLLREGAADYILKDRMSRLAPAIEAALTAAEQARKRQQAEESLRASEARYRALFESSRDALFTLAAPHWTINSCNPAALRMFGFDDQDELVGMGFRELSPEVQPEARTWAGRPWTGTSKDVIATALNEGVHFFEWTCKRRNGEHFYASVLLTRVELGGEQFLQVTVRDITVLKAAENSLRDSEQRYRSLFLSSPMPMWVYDPESLRILAVNHAATQKYGYSREEFQAITLKDIHLPEDAPTLEATLGATGVDGLKGSRIWRHRKRDGSRIEVEIYSDRMDYEGLPARIVQVNDITERRKAEMQAAEQLEELRRWNEATVGREDRILSIKHEVNALLANAGQPPRYPSAEVDI